MTRRLIALTMTAISALLPVPGIAQNRPEPPPAKTAPSKSPRAPAAAAAKTGVNHPTVRQWLRGMSLRDKVAQLLMIPCYREAPNTRSRTYREFVRQVRTLKVGGLIVVNRVTSSGIRQAEPYAMAAFLNRMQRLSKVPLIVGADFERGASMRVSSTTKFPHAMAYGAAGDTALTHAFGAATAEEARALGVHWVFAPSADVNNNPQNPIINTRSFGEDPQQVGKHVAAFVRGAHSNARARALVTAKHFPGHGDTDTDSHMSLPVLNAARERIDEVELPPFRAAIAAGVDAVMSAHIAVPAIDSSGAPSTVSAPILTKVLREELRFPGIVVTDAMDMQGLAKQFSSGEAAVRALEAGVDVLLMPPDPEAAIKAVLAAIRSGRLSAKRIEASAARLLAAKIVVGLHRSRTVSPDAIADTIDSDEFAEHAQAVAQRAVTLVKNEGSHVPLRNPDAACFVAMSESRYGQGGRRLMEELRGRTRKARTVLLDPNLPDAELERVASELSTCETIVAAAFISTGAHRGNTALAGNYGPFLEKVVSGSVPVVLVALGNPYLLRTYPSVASYLATFSVAPTAEAAAVSALFGEIPIRGKLPVSIPGLAKIGDGIEAGPPPSTDSRDRTR